ncbi:MAG: cobalamin B12-binding domain-containing protein [Planctomycetes bacterium]|nr:cobalamin B12-binding domain-containing protein [Planctomycetota bacterium]
MKILLVSANQEKVPYPVLPIGLCYVAESLEKAGHQVRLLDLCFERRTARALDRAVKEFEPALVGVGIRNMDNCDYYYPKNFVPEAKRVVAEIRAATKAPVMIGGSAVSVLPREMYEAIGADWAVVGDGELAAVELAKAVEEKRDPSGIAGVVSRGAEGVRVNPQNRVPALDVNTPPRMWRWVDPQRYMKFEGVYPLQSKRGCSLKCIYCTYTNIEGKSFRMKSGEEMAKEIEEIIERSGVRDFEFVDSTFNVPESHAIDICDTIIRRGIRANFVGSGLNPIGVSERLLGKMVDAGFRSLICTAESASDTVIRNLRKGFTRADVENVARLTARAGLRTLWIFLVGGPGETPETVLETLDFIHRHTAPGDVSYITNGVRIYPYTALAGIAIQEGLVRSQEELIDPKFYFSKALDRKWLRDTMIRHSRQDPRMITSERSQHPVIPWGLRVLSMLGVQKPFWRFVPAFNRMMRLVS